MTSYSPGIALIQPKLTVGQTNDRFEQEADAVADQVIKMPQSPPPIQRKCEDCEEEQLRMKPLSESITPIVQKQNEEEEELQMKGFDSGMIQTKPAETSLDISSKINQTKGSGSKLADGTNQFMSNAFGTDFSGVNIHTDTHAIQMSRSLGARAFTHGSDVYFNKGEYSPESGEGKRLLAHELTHVVQQKGINHTIQRAASDFRITEISPDDAANPDMIFFHSGQTSIPASETHKIAPLATPPTRNLTLNGFSSEEGTDAANDTFINARIQSVSNALVAAGHAPASSRTPVNLRSSGEGQLDYRHMRAVEVIPTPIGLAAAPSGVNPCGPVGSEVEPCGSAFTNAWPDADNAMNQAVTTHLTPPITGAASTLLSTLFSGVPQATVLTNMSNLAAQVHALPAQHRCHNSCDAGCDRPAYNERTGIGPPPPVGTGAMMTLCPDFLNSTNLAFQSRILIHESAHGTAGLNAEDIAYSNTRQISHLTPADQERNTDSYVLLAWLLYRPGSMTIGPATADTISGMTATEENHTREAVAWLESWLNYGSFDTAILYDTVNRSVPPAASWASNSTDVFNIETMHLLAPVFGLTDPGASAPFSPLPTDRDKTKIAAIHDRYSQMYSAINWQTLTVTKGAVGSDAWGSHGASLPRLDQSVTVGPAFFGMNAVDRIKHLVFLMASAMHGISPGFRRKYANAMDLIRMHRSLGP